MLRGGAEQFIEEAHRSLHDALCIVRRAMKHSYVVPGGGAIEMELSKILRGKASSSHAVHIIHLALLSVVQSVVHVWLPAFSAFHPSHGSQNLACVCDALTPLQPTLGRSPASSSW